MKVKLPSQSFADCFKPTNQQRFVHSISILVDQKTNRATPVGNQHKKKTNNMRIKRKSCSHHLSTTKILDKFYYITYHFSSKVINCKEHGKHTSQLRDSASNVVVCIDETTPKYQTFSSYQSIIELKIQLRRIQVATLKQNDFIHDGRFSFHGRETCISFVKGITKHLVYTYIGEKIVCCSCQKKLQTPQKQGTNNLEFWRSIEKEAFITSGSWI